MPSLHIIHKFTSNWVIKSYFWASTLHELQLNYFIRLINKVTAHDISQIKKQSQKQNFSHFNGSLDPFLKNVIKHKCIYVLPKNDKLES